MVHPRASCALPEQCFCDEPWSEPACCWTIQKVQGRAGPWFRLERVAQALSFGRTFVYATAPGNCWHNQHKLSGHPSPKRALQLSDT